MDYREQMNIVIVGHVDHGKSTVIGRLLADTGSLPQGKLESIKEYCRKNSKPFEYAFLLDALKDEQAQGITIDTARSFFKTAKRDYIIIDAPGHIEFLKNMVTGASRAEAALLVIDAKEGIQENSKRHGHMASMLGISQLVVLVNKMDLVEYDQQLFENIKAEFTTFLAKVNIKPITFIPISAFYGDNIATRSEKAPWYDGPTVLQQLDDFGKNKDQRQLPFRMPVQDIYKFTATGDDRRIVAGTILTGAISAGEEVLFLPSHKRSFINNIEGFNITPRHTAYADDATGFTLTTQIYITPGELMVKAADPLPRISSRFRVNIFWVGKTPFVRNRNYKLKIGATKIGVKLVELTNIIDAAELNLFTTRDKVERHAVAECILETTRPIAFDIISDIELNGRFVIVDNFEISGGGIILESLSDSVNTVTEHVSEREFLWDKSTISAEQREQAYQHKAKFVVITSGSEAHEQSIKEIAKELEQRLFHLGYKTFYLGIASLLHGLATGVADQADRDEQIRELGELARIITDSGQIFITSIFRLDDFEAEKLKLLNKPSEILVVAVDESPFTSFQPDAAITTPDLPGAVDEVCQLLKKHEILLDYCL
jgi:bifunctional enzyme CysN/CysC